MPDGTGEPSVHNAAAPGCLGKGVHLTFTTDAVIVSSVCIHRCASLAALAHQGWAGARRPAGGAGCGRAPMAWGEALTGAVRDRGQGPGQERKR